MGAVWSLQNKFQKWLDVEIAVCEVHAEDGTIPLEALPEIKAKAAFTVERINEIEKTTDHDVISILHGFFRFGLGTGEDAFHWRDSVAVACSIWNTAVQ